MVEVGWPLNAVCVASLVLVYLHDFAFAGRPELFQNAGKVWDLAYQLSLALLASYAFFYVNVHLPRQQDRENIQQFLNEKTFRIVQDAWTIVQGLQRSSGHSSENGPKDGYLRPGHNCSRCLEEGLEPDAQVLLSMLVAIQQG